MAWLYIANLAFAILAAVTPVAHLLELPNKLSLDAPVWLAVQQELYRGWGPFIGGPAEIGALLSSAAAAFVHRRHGQVFWTILIACIGYAGMIAVFFVLNRPVNDAVSSWTPSTLPADWPSYRIRWETGHAVAALLAMISLAAVVWSGRRANGAADKRDHRSRGPGARP